MTCAHRGVQHRIDRNRRHLRRCAAKRIGVASRAKSPGKREGKNQRRPSPLIGDAANTYPAAAAQPFMRPLMNDISVPPDRWQQYLIALRTIKTAMVFECRIPARERFTGTNGKP
jgi:hypothetical protein